MIPKIQITEKGIIAPSTEEVKAGVWDVLKAAFGTDLNQSESTPQGQLAVSITAIIQQERNEMIYLMNQIDPRYSEGIWQDAIGEIYFMKRKESTRSSATVEFSGLRNTVIPSNFLLADVAGNQWRTTSQVTIPTSGKVSASVVCMTDGAINAAPNTITTIVQALAGVDRVTNLTPAIAGKLIESRADFEQRRIESVSSNSQIIDASVRGSVAALNDVFDVYVASNNDSSAKTIGATNYSLPKNSMVLSVVGGSNEDIAWTYLVKAGTGVTMAGNTTVTVEDSDSYPQSPASYSVKFLRPTEIQLRWRIVVQDKSKISYQQDLALKQAIVDAMKFGATRARIAQSIRPVMYSQALYAVMADLQLVDLLCSIDGTNFNNFIELGIDQFPVTTTSNVEITNA